MSIRGSSSKWLSKANKGIEAAIVVISGCTVPISLTLIFAMVGFGISLFLIEYLYNGILVYSVGGLLSLSFIMWYPAALLSTISVSLGRLLLFLRYSAPDYWRNHTPPFDENQNDRSPKSVSSAEITRARTERNWHIILGLLVYFIMFFVLSVSVVHYSTILNQAITAPQINSIIGAISNFSAPVAGIIEILSTLEISRSEVLVLTMLVIGPAVFLAPAARNQQFIAESQNRKEIQEKGIRDAKNAIVSVVTGVFFTLAFTISLASTIF